MTNKHLALIIVGLMAFLCLQTILWVRGNRDKTIQQADALRAEETTQRQLLAIQSSQINQLKATSRDLVSFLDEWEKPLNSFKVTENAEAMFITKVREANLATVSQKFDRINLKAGSSLGAAVRAQLIFEDDYARLLNWVGKMEQEFPTLRVSGISISQGTRPGEIRLEATMDQPLYTP
jgi:phosphoheptose isomerase